MTDSFLSFPFHLTLITARYNMAPAPLTPEMESLVTYFESCGLSSTRSSEAARSKYSSAADSLFHSAQLDQQPLDDKQGALALQVAKDGNALEEEGKLYIIERIRNGDLAKSDQVTGKHRTDLIHH